MIGPNDPEFYAPRPMIGPVAAPGLVEASTRRCPGCRTIATVLLTKEEYDGLTGLGERTFARRPIQVVLARFDADTRERFLSGYCPECWSKYLG